MDPDLISSAEGILDRSIGMLQEGNDVQIDVAFDVHDSLPIAMVHVTV